MRFGLPVGLLIKAGFERGPMASHKYWKRTRVMRNGKAAWKYYYNTPEDRKRWLEEQAKLIEQHQHKVHELEEHHRAEHADKAEFREDHPELKAARKALKELSVEYVTSLLTWDKPPHIKISPEAMTAYHTAVVEMYGDNGEPDELHGRPISVLRATELAFDRLPTSIKKHFSGAISELMLALTDEDSYLKEKPGVAGYCEWAKSGGGSRIVFDIKRSQGLGSGPHMKGGLFPTEVLIHEMAHAIHNQIGARAIQMIDNWKGPTFLDFEAFMEGPGKDEEPVTDYAGTNVYERWAESFTAALMYPKQLAGAAPKMYDWMRSFFGPDAMRPLHTDQAEHDRQKALMDAAVANADFVAAEKHRTLMDMAVGVLDMADDDGRLQWWKKKGTRVQTLLEDYHRKVRETGDPYALMTPLSDDKHYEMSIGGRSIFFRVGRSSPTEEFSGWEPGKPGKNPLGEGGVGRYQLGSGEIKEIYDAEGRPLTNDTAWWYLNQDGLADDHPDVGGLMSFLEKGEKGGDNAKALDRFRLNKKLADIAVAAASGKLDKPGKKGGEGYTSAHLPVEMSPEQFRLRSGRFAYDRWDMAGHAEFDRLSQPGLPAQERRALEAAFRAKQPGVEMHFGRVTRADVESGALNPKTGKPYTNQEIGRVKPGVIASEATEPGKAPVPKLHTIRYLNDNPDGTKTAIDVKRRDKGPGKGFYFIDSPVWRQLLTPNDEHITSAEHLKELCARAAAERRRAWVSVQTDTRGGDTPHYYHVQIEFDGRGQPRVLGDEWKRRLGRDDPRIDHLLTGMQVNGVETARPEVRAEPIKLAKRKQKRGPRIPKPGESAILEVSNNEVGRQVESPPGWDRMPETVPGPEGFVTVPPFPPATGKAQSLWKEERELIAQGILPATYNGSELQRQWKSRYLQPLVDKWKASQKRPVKVRLLSLVPEKKAGEPPAPPGWDRMPEGRALFPDVEPSEESPKKLTKRERALKKQGLLPEHYTGTPTQRTWLADHYEPAWKHWEDTLEAVTAQELPAQYVFVAEKGSGFPGRIIRRWGADHLLSTLREPIETVKPEALKDDVLIYVHAVHNPVNGEVQSKELRMLLPKNGRLDPHGLEGVRGIKLIEDSDGRPAIRVTTEGFGRLREWLGACSLTQEAEDLLRSHVDLLKQIAERASRQEHVVEIEDLSDIGRLSRGEVQGYGPVGLKPTMPNGAPFELAEHQKELVQLTMDNGGRALGAHYMGTGKTYSAIVTAKLALAARDPEDPGKPHPNAPKKVLIVAPLNTVEQWRQATFDIDEGCTVVGADSGAVPVDLFVENVKTGRDSNDIVVCGPEYFTLNQAKLREAGFDGLIVDEAHMGIKNEKSQRNAAIREWNPDMKVFQLLTGTPITTSPADMLEYVKLLSKGEQWADLTRQEFIDTYLEVSAVPAEAGGKKAGPKIQIKPGKRAELAAIIAQWTHIAMPKDVRGKTLPAVRIEENKHAHMTGTQALLYAMHMAALSPADRERLTGNNGTLSEDELAGLDDDSKKRVQLAKAIANNVAYKPASDDRYIMTTRKIPGAKPNEFKEEKVIFTTFDPAWLMQRPDLPDKVRGKLAGRWPKVEDLGEQTAAIYSAMLRDVIGGDYESVAGQRITPPQLARMKAAGWPKQLANPDAGPVGVRFRGSDRPNNDPEYLARREQAELFQRQFGNLVREGLPQPSGKPKKVTADEALAIVAAQHGVSEEEAMRLLGTRPDDFVHDDTVTINGVTLSEGDNAVWYSDTRGSLHLLYRPEDWDTDNNRPRSAGGFDKVKDGDRVTIGSKYMPKPEIPPGTKKEERQRILDEWVPPDLVYDAAETMTAEADNTSNRGLAAVRRTDTSAIVWVPKSAVSAVAKSLMDPGMREERAKADIAMTHGNAKAEELKLAIREFHRSTGPGHVEPGRYGARQMVLFANGILDGCRTIEAALRVQGFKDVNEALEGSREYDRNDPNPAGNGKYFVTYIGSTYTGVRDLNAEIFKKRKDRLGRDLPESLFVHKTNDGRDWRMYPSAPPHPSVKLSQWTPEAREEIRKQFRINAPESFYTGDDGVKRYFYGSKKKVTVLGQEYQGSEAILREMVLTGDPTRMGLSRQAIGAMGPKDREALGQRIGARDGSVDAILEAQAGQAAAAQRKLEALQAAYEGLVQAEAKSDPPLTAKQTGVFNNCEFIVCSDAAQVGLNFGNAVEMINYDSLGSPMAEWQRITRSARMLPPAVADELIGKPIMIPVINDAGEPQHNEDGTPAMVPWLDDQGKIRRDNTGPFARIRITEGWHFMPKERGAMAGVLPSLELGGRELGEMTFSQAMASIVSHAETEAKRTTGRNAEEWGRIAKKAQAAHNLGTNAILAFLEEMSRTQTPGGTTNVLSHGQPRYQDPMAGTYDEVETHDAEAAIRRAIDETLTESERAMIAKAGFVAPGVDGKQGGSLDAAGIYLAIRAQEILEHVERQRDIVGARMRAAAGGAIVQDSDVMNAIIDSLNPADRAILKSKKYLVNVRKLAVSANMPTHETVKGDGGASVRVFVGFERQHPIDTERNVRNVARARMTAVEQLWADVQAKAPVRTAMDYETTGAEEIGHMSAGHLAKSGARIGVRNAA